jgi:hypothetical protein
MVKYVENKFDEDYIQTLGGSSLPLFFFHHVTSALPCLQVLTLWKKQSLFVTQK